MYDCRIKNGYLGVNIFNEKADFRAPQYDALGALLYQAIDDLCISVSRCIINNTQAQLIADNLCAWYWYK